MDANFLQFILWLLSLFAGAILACQLAYASTVVDDIKRLLCLDAERDFTKYNWKWWFKPIMVLWLELRALLNCPFCMSFWIGLIINLTLWDLTIGPSAIYALLSLPLVEVYRKLTL